MMKDTDAMHNLTTGALLANSFKRFLRDESGSATADMVVMAGFMVANGMAFAYDTATAVSDYGDDLQLCMKRQGNILKGGGKSNAKLDYAERLAKVERRCGQI